MYSYGSRFQTQQCAFIVTNFIKLFQIAQLSQVPSDGLFHKVRDARESMLPALNSFIDLCSEAFRQVDSVIIIFPLAHSKNSYNDLF